MKQYFYSHLINLESVLHALEESVESEVERLHLFSLVTTNVHHVIISLILSELSHEDKKLFLEHLGRDDSWRIWKLLHKKVVGIEKKIKQAGEEIIKEIHTDIQEAHRENAN